MQRAESTPNPEKMNRKRGMPIRSIIAMKIMDRISSTNQSTQSNKGSKGSNPADELEEFQLAQLESDNSDNVALGVPNIDTAHSFDQGSNTPLTHQENVNKMKHRVPFNKYMSDNRGFKGHSMAKSADSYNGKAWTRNSKNKIKPIAKKESKRLTMTKVATFRARFSEKMQSIGFFKDKSSKPDSDLNDIDEEDEPTSTPRPKQEVGLRDFVHIVNEIIQVVQSLNHQSISRWRKTEEFQSLQDQLNLGQLATHLPTPTPADVNNAGRSSKSMHTLNNTNLLGIGTPRTSKSKTHLHTPNTSTMGTR